MGVTYRSLTSGNSASGSSVNTASVSPVANKLITIAVFNARGGAAATLPTVSGASMTWTQVATVTANSGNWRITLFRAMSVTPGSGALTISFGGTNQDQGIFWFVNEFSGVVTTGTNGADAIVQSPTNTTSGTNTTITVTLSNFAKSSNATYGFCGTQGTSPVVGSGFTQINSQSTAAGRGIDEFKSSQDTTVDFTWNSTGAQSFAIAIELKFAESGGAFLNHFI